MALEDDEDEFLYGEPSAKKLKTDSTTDNSKKHQFKLRQFLTCLDSVEPLTQTEIEKEPTGANSADEESEYGEEDDSDDESVSASKFTPEQFTNCLPD